MQTLILGLIITAVVCFIVWWIHGSLTFKVYETPPEIRTQTERIIEYMKETKPEVNCEECGVSLLLAKAQEVKIINKRYDYHAALHTYVYYCDRHQKPYDRYSQLSKKYHKEFEVNEKGKIIK